MGSKSSSPSLSPGRTTYMISTMHPAPSADRGGELRQLVLGAAAVAAVEPHRVPRVGQGRPGKQLRHPVKD